MEREVGGDIHLKLNIGERPIANKYREGKMKSTLERELNSMRNRWKQANQWVWARLWVPGAPLAVCDLSRHLACQRSVLVRGFGAWLRPAF